MDIISIYKRKRNFYVSIVIAFLCIFVTFLSIIKPGLYEFLAYAYPIKFPWQLLTGVFLHGSPDLSFTGKILHLLFNLFLVLPFGILIEKTIGSKNFLILTTVLWIINIFVFYLIAIFTTPVGEFSYGAGISGISFSYGTIGLYVLVRLFIIYKSLLLKQISFYILLNIILIMLAMINPFITGISSLIIHLAAIASGAVYLLFQHDVIDNSLNLDF